MKTISIQKRTFFSLIILTILGASLAVMAQNDVTRRLYVATSGGFELNEPAAKDALKAGADINWQNDQMGGETMLIMGIKSFNEPKVIKFLLDNGADASIKDDSGKTALNWANQYNIGRNRSGREIMAMLEAAGNGGQTKTEVPEKNTGNARPLIQPAADNAAVPAGHRTEGQPTAAEIKTMLEQKMTSIYEDHYCCNEKNTVEFEWLAPLLIGGQETRGRIPVSCWAVKVDLKVTFTKPSSGETGSVRRGINGNPVKEGFCVYKDAYDEWTYLTYGL